MLPWHFINSEVLDFACFYMDLERFETTTVQCTYSGKNQKNHGALSYIQEPFSSRQAGINFLVHAIFIALKIWIWQIFLQNSKI